MKVDIGAFDLAVRVGAKVDWLEPSTDHAVLNLRQQFQANLDLLTDQYQKFFAKSLSTAIRQDRMYFETPDLNMKGMSDDQLDELKDLG